MHWTYDSFEGSDNLEQGDILEPSKELKELLGKTHNHFIDNKYVGFLVTTQSCDLVQRKGTAKALYINLAVIRPLSNIIDKLISQISDPIKPGLFAQSKKEKANELLNRIFNQNEQALGLYFLHEDLDAAGIAEPSIAQLRVTVAVKRDCYEILQQARVGRLDNEFRSKLGWLIGNLYARPATRDWQEVEGDNKNLEKLISEYVDDKNSGSGPKWIKDEKIKEAVIQGIDINMATYEDLEKINPPSTFDLSLIEIQAELIKVAPDIDMEIVNKFKNRLNNNGKLKKLFPK